MTTQLPMFPLNTVLFPGAVVPLHVFEPRYLALVRRLLEESDPSRRLFGSVAIREGYEVGDHGAQSLFRVGCRLQLTEVSQAGDGYEIEAVARDRIRLDRLDPTGDLPMGEVTELPDDPGPADPSIAARASAAFEGYRRALAALGEQAGPDRLPNDPEFLSWALAGAAPLPLSERQQLLECGSATERLELLTDLLRAEVAAIRAFPSLPATQVARTRWSPN